MNEETKLTIVRGFFIGVLVGAAVLLVVLSVR